MTQTEAGILFRFRAVEAFWGLEAMLPCTRGASVLPRTSFLASRIATWQDLWRPRAASSAVPMDSRGLGPPTAVPWGDVSRRTRELHSLG